MKKLGTILMTALVAVLALSSCSEPTARQEEAIATAIQNNEKLSNDQISTMIKYVGEYAEKAQPLYDDIINGQNDSIAGVKIQDLTSEYPALNLFRNRIKTLPKSWLNDENLQLLQKYGQYLEFSMPASVAYQTLPGTAGLEEQTPDSVNNGVVAGPQLETKTTGRGW